MKTNTAPVPQWIPLHEAVNIEGSSSTKRLSEWISKWNSRTDTIKKVRRRSGKVELQSLIAALEEDEEKFGGLGQNTREAMRDLAKKRQFCRPAMGGR